MTKSVGDRIQRTKRLNRQTDWRAGRETEMRMGSRGICDGVLNEEIPVKAQGSSVTSGIMGISLTGPVNAQKDKWGCRCIPVNALGDQ